MNEQALQDAYNLFVSQGYKNSIDDFKKLIATNPEALNDSYGLFKSQGYNKSVDDYKNLLGISAQSQQPILKKKDTTVSPSAVGSSVSPKPTEEPTEEDYFTGSFGTVLRGIDMFSPIGVGDFIDDVTRAAVSGYKGAKSSEESGGLLLQGTKPSNEQVDKFIAANKNVQAMKPSAEMQEYQKIYEKEGKGFFGVIKGLVTNPTVLPELITSSLVGLATNRDALLAGATAVGTGAAAGATTGGGAGSVVVPGIGTVTGAGAGAIAGAGAAIPYAFGLASSVLESGSTFGELLTEELKGKEMTRDNVKAILEDPEKYTNIRNKAIARGLIIGTADALTGKLASSVGAKILTKSAAKSATGAATKAAVTKAVGVGAGVEAVGGSLGEATARAAIGQDMDVSEIALEGLAELPGGFRSTLQARFAKPSYTVNGAKATAEQVDEIINTMSPADLAKTKIEIKNDYEGREFKIQDKIVTNSIKEQVRQGNPELNEPSLNAITDLEKELKKLEGNTTQTGKDKAAAIRQQIKGIQENQIQEEAKVATVEAIEAPEVTQKRIDRISELEDTLSPESTVALEESERLKLQTELETLKKEQDAIQKQSTDESVLRSQQPQVGLQQVVEGNVQPEVVTTGTEEVAVEQPQQEEVTFADLEEKGEPVESTLEAERRRSNGERIFAITEQDGQPIEVTSVEMLNNYTPDQLIAYKPIAVKKVSSKTLTQEEQIARMEEMFAEKEAPQGTVENQGTSISDAPALEQVKSKVKDAKKLSIIDSAQRALTTLKSVFPNFDIVIHDTNESYAAAMDANQANRDSAGSFTYTKNADGSYSGTININLTKANQRTVAHELAHAIMLRAFGENVETFKTFKNRMASILSESSNKQLMDFASQYAEVDSYEEYLAELTAALEQQEGKIDATTLQKIAALINEFVSKITNGTFTPFEDIKDTKQTIEFFKNISESIRKGEVIKESDIAIKTGEKRATKSERKTKAQLIGRNAQLSATVKFNLNLAEVMDKNKMSAQDIRIATGWEKGLDGKWRYEIPYGKFKDLDINDLKREIKADGKVVRSAKLSDVFDAPELYNAYPEIKDTKVVFEDLAANIYGSFSISENKIRVNQKLYNENRPEADLTMIHEIQHYVQEKELFEQGSNQSVAPVMMKYIIKEFKNKVDSEKRVYDYVKSMYPDNKEAIKKARDFYKSVKDRYAKVKDLSFEKKKKEIKEGVKKFNEENKMNFSVEDMFGKKAASAFNLYYRVAGEVEARNAENRSKLTPEERRKTLLSETENIDREDQIMFDNSNLLFSEEVQNLKEEFPISKSQLINENKISKVIKDARAQGFSEDAIKIFLEGKGLTSQAITQAMATETQAAGKVNITEEMLPGYESLMSKIDSLIKKGESLKSILSTLKNSTEYINATDIQKEKLVRELRKKLGIREKSAPLAQRLLGLIQDVTKITMTEKQLFNKQIKDLARGAKDAKKLWRQVSGGLTKEIKELASSGKITAKQMAAVLRKFSSVDMFNEKSIDKFVDYMVKVFGDAEYASKLDFARNMLSTAKKNIATKIGIADGLYADLNKLFSINPSLIPDSVLDSYLELVDMFGKRQAVLDLKEKSQVKNSTEKILDAIAEEQSVADELADLFNESPNKVFGDEGKLDFAESIKEMLKQGEITQEQADIMRKYKSDIMPQVEPKKMTEQEIAEEKEGLIKEIEDVDVNVSGLPSADERSLATQLKELIKTKAIDKLSNTELKNLLKVINNINNNYLPHYAEIMVEKLNGINDGARLSSAIGKGKLPKLSTLYAKFKNLFTGKGAVLEMVRRNPLYYIDQVFGDFKTKEIFDSLLKPSAEAEARFSSELKKIQNILEKAEEKVAKSFGLDPNKTLMSKFKMMTYMIQLEYESNVGDKQVNPASDYLKATIKHIDEGKSSFGEKDAEMLQDILDKYTDAEGNIDNNKLLNSFNQAEKDAIKDIRGVNESLRGKAEYTAAIIRGDKISPLNNYVHLNVLHETKPNELTSGSAFITEYNDSMRPSTKAKSLIARTGKVSPLNFDVFASAQRGAKFVLMDYNLTKPIRTARKALNQALLNLEEKGRLPKENRQIFNAIRDAFEESIENLLTNSYISNAFLDDAINYISKQGYRSVLAGTSRFVAELGSNIGFAVITDPAAAKTGYDNMDVIMSVDAPTIMNNVGSTQTNRIFPTDTLSGKLVDTNILKQASGIKGGKAKGYIANKIQQIFNRTGKKYVNSVELVADTLISTPDKIVMRPIWFGSFANEFKKITGQDINFDKIAANDEAYMSKYKEAINQAKTTADERSVFTGATDNAFMGILKGTPKPNQSGWLRAFNNFNNFMTRFLIFEYATARTGINAAIGNGTLTKKQGAALVAAVTTRMMVYTLVTQALGNGLMGLFFDDEEEEDDDSILQNIGQAFASAFSSMVLGRDFGNATKLFINEGVERANEEYLGFLREGKYDRYKDNIQNSLVPPEKKGRQTGVWDYVQNMGGAFTPLIKTTDLIIKNASAKEPKTKAAQERREKENTMRIPLEIAGNAGLIPMYKDIRKAVMNDIYKDLDKNKGNEKPEISENQSDQIEALRELKDKTNDEDKLKEINKKIREIRATGEEEEKYKKANKREAAQKKALLYDSEREVTYDNPSEMKKYNPRLYNENFGPNSDWYQKHKAETDINKAMNKQIRKMEDEEFGYRAPDKKRNADGSFKRNR